jgi:hypothetical protein
VNGNVADWTATPDGSVDWRVAFAEVFKNGGFNIVLANPPYIRQELLGREYKEEKLKPVFPEVYGGIADLYVYFFGRAHQLLHKNGIACFISSNKWLRAAYGEKLRQYLLDSQAFHLVVDFGELPVFEAATFPAIFLWQKRPRKNVFTTWAVVKNLQTCYQEGLANHILQIGVQVPAVQFGTGGSRLASSDAVRRIEKMKASGRQLGKYVNGQFFRGVVSGCNEAFVIDRPTHDALIKEDANSKDLLKPLLRGDDIRRYELHYREEFYIFVKWQYPIKDFPAILNHLKKYETQLKSRPEVKAGRYPWYAMSRYGSDFVHLFDRTKILYPVIGKELRFVMDKEGYYGNDKTFMLSIDDWYLLAVLNSIPALDYLKATCSVLGDELKGGRLEFRGIHMETLPIPEVSNEKKKAVEQLARQTQQLHTNRRKRVENFLLALGTSPAASSSRNPLEQPWKLTPEEFARRCKKADPQLFAEARDETAALTEEIAKLEQEIDSRVAGLYGLE